MQDNRPGSAAARAPLSLAPAAHHEQETGVIRENEPSTQSTRTTELVFPPSTEPDLPTTPVPQDYGYNSGIPEDNDPLPYELDPLQHGPGPLEHRLDPPLERPAPPLDGSAPPYDSSVPPLDSSAPPYDSSAPPYDSSTTPLNRSAPPQERSVPPYERPAVPQDRSGPSQERSAPPFDRPTPQPDRHGALYTEPAALEETQPPPAYSDTVGQIGNESTLGTNASIADDGRVNIRINEKSRRLSQLLVPALRSQLVASEALPLPPPPYIPPSLGGDPTKLPPPPMNVVIHVVGSRGDVQPFVALGKVLQQTYHHRVRLATHPVFQKFVEENGLEFFSIGGDPAELMAFMVKNPGLVPGFETIRNGDVGKKRKGIEEMIKGCWRSCIEAGNGIDSIPASDDIADSFSDLDGEMLDDAEKPFVADAIIANPPSFAHVHCAEKLGIPLHMMFTMPWSPTQAFPHPLANVQSSNTDTSLSNFMSYALVDMLTWQGLGDMINRFRVYDLGLEPISLIWAPGMLHRLRIPWTYCWSPALIPKPKDWLHNISISGFYFLDLATNYTPAPDLDLFLHSGPPPVYIGFGSIVVDDPNAMTKMIFEAVVKSGQRALVSKGWGGLGADELGVPDGIFMLGNVPHDWLFKHVSCVVHHGGAGTTAAGIAAGRPTVIVPFFGDQPFWGAMVAKAGAGPPPIPYKQLNAQKLADAILEALKPESLDRAKDMANKISSERGCDKGAQSFHQMLNVDDMRCSLLPERVAVWRVKRTKARLSTLAATTLIMQEQLSFNDLKLYRPREYATEDGPWDPLTGSASALMGTISGIMMGVADLPIETLKALQIHPDARKKDNGEGSSSSPQTTRHSVSSSKENLSSTDTRPGSSTLSLTSSNSTTGGRSRSDTFTEEPGELTPTESGHSSLRGPMSPTTPITPSAAGTPTPNALAEALRSSRTRSGSRGRSQSPSRRCTFCRGPSDDDQHQKSPDKCPNHFSVSAALGTGKGVSRIIGTGLKAPMDFSLGLARGFHNLPRLYGDDTVRPLDPIDSFQSGMKTVGKEFGLSFYDGVTGVVTQPIKGAKKEGAAGFLKGMGKGFAGLIVKPAAGIYGIPGYAFRGIWAEIRKNYSASVSNYIIAARSAQGYEDYRKISEEERRDIVNRWVFFEKDLKRKQTLKSQLETVKEKARGKKKKQQEFFAKFHRHKSSTGLPDDDSSVASDDTRSLTHASSFPMLSHAGSHKGSISRVPVAGGPSSSRHPASPIAGTAAASISDPSLQAQLYEQDERDLTDAIRESLSHPSSTNEEEQQLERAITVSMAELQRARQTMNEDEAMEHAMRASVIEANRSSEPTAAETAELEEALKRSTTEHSRTPRGLRSGQNDSDTDDDDDEDEQLKLAMEMSLKGVDQEYRRRESLAAGSSTAPGESSTAPTDTAAAAVPTSEPIQEENEEDAIKRAIEESEREHKQREREKSEEEIVLEYVKRQSLLEEQHKKKLLGQLPEDDAGEGSSK